MGRTKASILRYDMVFYCFTEGMRSPMGNGLGSFATDYGDPRVFYPHNIAAEAFFELGACGLACITTLIAVALRTCWQLFQRGDRDIALFGLLAATAFVLKAGDLSTAGVWLFWIYIGSSSIACTQHNVLLMPLLHAQLIQNPRVR